MLKTYLVKPMISQLTANCFTTEQLRIQFRSQPLTNMSLKFPELQVLYWKSDWHWRVNSLLNITVISDCKHLHWQTKKSWKNITLQQHCIRRKDATENLETTKDQFTSRLARWRRLHMTIRTTSLSSHFSAP